MAIICHCEVIKERTIVKAICRGARTVEDVQDACGASARCGGCTGAVLELLARHAPEPAGHPAASIAVA